MPSTPPISREVFVIADPSPARWGPTEFITAAVIGAIVAPMPWPIIANTGHMSAYGVSTDNRSSSKPVPAKIRPYVIGIPEPCLDAYRPAFGAVTMIISVIGRKRTPAPNAL